MDRLVYLDHQATTPLDPGVFEAMRPWLDGRRFGNPHSATHRAGWRAAEAVEEARAEVAALIGAEQPGEIVFTSGATEANNLALFGASDTGWTVIASAIEHPSVLDCLPALERRERRAVVVGVDAEGRADLGHLARALAAAAAEGPALVSMMAANNETGVIQPLAEVARLCQAGGARLHTDAVQLLSTAALDVRALGVDLLSLSGHKLYGPMGVGALFVREGVEVAPQLFGGGQQHGIRPGTLPTALCVGLGAACRIARQRHERDAARLLALRGRLDEGLGRVVPGLRRTGDSEHTLPGCLHAVFPGVDAEDMLLDLPELALSTGSACASGKDGPSHVLLAMGLDPEDIHGSVRFGLGRTTTEADVDFAVERIGAWFRTRGR